MREVMDISSKDRMEDLQSITKTILCLQRIGHNKGQFKQMRLRSKEQIGSTNLL